MGLIAAWIPSPRRSTRLGEREVEMYIRTYQTMLRSSGDVGLKTLVQAHYNIDSVLHPNARDGDPDMSAFIYTVLRLPTAILRCSRVLLGQSDDVFAQHGFQVDQWQAVTASARRRKWFYDGKNTLAVFIASVSDTDDIVPTLVALQIEWNKFQLAAQRRLDHHATARKPRGPQLAGLCRDHQGRARAAARQHRRLAAARGHLGR